MTICNAMTVDVEDYFHVSALAGVIKRADWEQRESRVVNNTRRLLALFERHGVRATFFVLGWVAEREPGLVREIARAGHEVACHGYSHELVYRQTPTVFRDETVRAKRLLEDLIGAPIAGYRAASYSIVKSSWWALDILSELGFEYDSSVFPIRHDRYGVPDAPREPYAVTTPQGRKLVEFPLSTALFGGYRFPVSGGGYFRLFPYVLTRFGLRRINDNEHRPFIFYLHPWEIDPDQPRVKASLLSRFRHYNNLSRCEARLDLLVKEFRFGSVRDVLAQSGLLRVAARDGEATRRPLAGAQPQAATIR